MITLANRIFSAISRQLKLEPNIKRCLKNVYGVLMLINIFAAIGGYSYDLYYDNIIKIYLLLLCLFVTRTPFLIYNKGYSNKIRLSYLIFFSYSFGIIYLAPPLSQAINLDPVIIIQGFLCQSIIIACISLSVIFAPIDYYNFVFREILFFIIIFNLFLLEILNLYIESQLISRWCIYFGIFIISGLIGYNTHNIIEDVRLGNRDFVRHSFNLFIYFVYLYKEILTALINQRRIFVDIDNYHIIYVHDIIYYNRLFPFFISYFL